MLQDYVHLDENVSFDQVPQLILDQFIKEREEFNQRYQALERENNFLRIGNLYFLSELRMG